MSNLSIVPEGLIATLRDTIDEAMIEEGWRPKVIHPRDASLRLAAVEGRTVDVVCLCGHPMRTLEVFRIGRGHGVVADGQVMGSSGYRRVVVPAVQRRGDGNQGPFLAGPPGTHMLWTFRCNRKKCKTRHNPFRYDRLTLEFILAAEEGRGSLYLPLDDPRNR